MSLIKFVRKSMGMQSNAERASDFASQLGIKLLSIEHDFHPRSIMDIFVSSNSAGLYNHELDQVLISEFLTDAQRAQVILHEVAHWTGAINRLNRVWLSTQGRLSLLADGQDLDAARNHEECVADIASKMLWHYLGLNANAFNEIRHAQYLHLHGQGVDVKLAMQEAFQVVDFCDDLIKGTGQKLAA